MTYAVLSSAHSYCRYIDKQVGKLLGRKVRVALMNNVPAGDNGQPKTSQPSTPGVTA